MSLRRLQRTFGMVIVLSCVCLPLLFWLAAGPTFLAAALGVVLVATVLGLLMTLGVWPPGGRGDT